MAGTKQALFLFPCHVSLAHFPALYIVTSIVAVLQAPDGVYPKTHAVQIMAKTIVEICISHAYSTNELDTRAGKFTHMLKYWLYFDHLSCMCDTP